MTNIFTTVSLFSEQHGTAIAGGRAPGRVHRRGLLHPHGCAGYHSRVYRRPQLLDPQVHQGL